MKFQERKLLWLMTMGLVSLGGCQPPHGARYNNAAYDSPSYDSVTYVPKYTVQPFYEYSYYHDDAYVGRQ